MYADRFYTSIPLLQYLHSKGFYYTGTENVHRKFFPQFLKTLGLDFIAAKWYKNDDSFLLVAAFRDKKEKKKIVLWSQVKEKLPCRRFKGSMSSSANLSASTNITTLRMAVIVRISEWVIMAFINASILYDKSRVRNENYRKLKLKEFKDRLINEILEAISEERVNHKSMHQKISQLQ